MDHPTVNRYRAEEQPEPPAGSPEKGDEEEDGTALLQGQMEKAQTQHGGQERGRTEDELCKSALWVVYIRNHTSDCTEQSCSRGLMPGSLELVGGQYPAAYPEGGRKGQVMFKACHVDARAQAVPCGEAPSRRIAAGRRRG